MDDTHLYHSPINTDDHSDSQDSDSTELAHHSAVQNDRPLSVWPLTTEVVAGLYEGEDDESILQVFNSNGERLITSYLDSTPTDQDTALVDPEAETAVIGSIGIHWGNDSESTGPDGTEPESTNPEPPGPEIVEPDITNFTPAHESLLHGPTLWGEATDGPARVDMSDPQAQPQVYEVFSDEDPPPVLVTDRAAYVEAPRVDQTLLYRAEHQPPGETGSPANEDEEDTEDEEQEEGS